MEHTVQVTPLLEMPYSERPLIQVMDDQLAGATERLVRSERNEESHEVDWKAIVEAVLAGLTPSLLLTLGSVAQEAIRS